ncbi:hypothetical protein V2J94_45310 [Streptomyces sp. DSM 41524]|uniref:Ornithine cyclodeaminase n=1 Tax=Streptomyces asiaticus subsp. ignotus TaxID=3098222 RepID=A0ABU7QC31_9ACTN|nr:hypothetical protein [Streptomyces sp. DSM 41524]
MTPAVRCLDDAEVDRLLTLDDAVTTLRRALGSEPAMAPVSMPKALGTWPDGSLHALGAHWTSSGYAGVKTWINTSAGAQSVYCLFDTAAGGLLGIFRARSLGRLRTAAVGALGLQAMVPADTGTLALLGTGRQARAQLAGAAAVLPLTRVRVWSPTTEHRTSFSAAMADEFGIEVIPAGSVADAVRDVGAVVTVTRARAPFLRAADLRPDVHINAMGAILPGAAELDADVVRSARSVVVDDVASALENSTELRTALRDDPGFSGRVSPLGEVLRAPGVVRPGLTIFKSVGLGACDLVLAVRVYEAARLGAADHTRTDPTTTQAEEK